MPPLEVGGAWRLRGRSPHEAGVEALGSPLAVARGDQRRARAQAGSWRWADRLLPAGALTGPGLERDQKGRARCPSSPGSHDPSRWTAACSLSQQAKADLLRFQPRAPSVDGTLPSQGPTQGIRSPHPTPHAGVTTVTRRRGHEAWRRLRVS